MKKLLSAAAAVVALAGSAQAQAPDILIVGGVTANAFKGELNGYYNRFTPGLHLSLQLNRKKRLNGTFNFQLGRLQMQSSTFRTAEGSTGDPSRFVETNFAALHYDLHLNVLKTDHWIVYISQGAGLLRFNPKDAQGRNLADNSTTRARGEDYSPISVTLPTSAGAMHIFRNGYTVGLQAGLLNPLTKYLDNTEDLAATKRADNVLQYRVSFGFPLSFSKDTPPRME